MNIFIQENAFESVVFETAAISSRPQCVKCFLGRKILVDVQPSSLQFLEWQFLKFRIVTINKKNNANDNDVSELQIFPLCLCLTANGMELTRIFIPRGSLLLWKSIDEPIIQEYVTLVAEKIIFTTITCLFTCLCVAGIIEVLMV